MEYPGYDLYFPRRELAKLELRLISEELFSLTAFDCLE